MSYRQTPGYGIHAQSMADRLIPVVLYMIIRANLSISEDQAISDFVGISPLSHSSAIFLRFPVITFYRTFSLNVNGMPDF